MVFLSHYTGGVADGVLKAHVLRTSAKKRKLFGRTVLIGSPYDIIHDANRLHRVSPHGGFGTEHNRIGSVENRIGNIRRFSPCRSGIINHGFEHLCGGYYRFVFLIADIDDAFLEQWNFFSEHFHTQIASSHHYHLGLVHDTLQIVNGFRFLDFGNDRNTAAFRNKNFPQFPYISVLSDKRKRDVVHRLSYQKIDILPVFFRDTRQGNLYTGKVNPFSGLQHTIVEHEAADIRCIYALNFQLNKTVVDEYPVTGFQIACEFGVSGWNLVLSGILRIGCKNYTLPRFYRDIRAEIAQSDFGPSKIGKDGNRLPGIPAHCQNCFYILTQFLRAGMGTIQSCNVHPGSNELFQHGNVI